MQGAERATGSSVAGGAFHRPEPTTVHAKIDPRGRACVRLSHACSIAAAAALLLGACADRTSPTAPTTRSEPSQLLVATPVSFSQVITGGFHSCAVSTAGEISCWGSNPYGPLSPPAGVQSGIAEVSGAYSHVCALSTAGAVACWGDNEWGETTVPPAAQAGIARVSAGGAHTCALSTSGTVLCWGYFTGYGSLVPPAAQSGVTQLSVGGQFTCTLGTTGSPFCWDREGRPQSIPVASQTGIARISAGADYTCTVSTGGTVDCWGGYNSHGQSTVPPAALSGMAQVSAGDQHTCAVSTTSTVLCWGRDDVGQATVPPAVQGNAVQVSVGRYHTCARSTAGTVTCWGYAFYGATTVPTTTMRVLPTATLTAPAAVIESQSFTIALTGAQVTGYPSTTFMYAFDCGDGTGHAAATVTASRSCATTAPGTLSVRAKVIDQDGDATEYTRDVIVTAMTPAQRTSALRDAIGAAAMSPDIRRPLTTKLDDVLKALSNGQIKAACNSLGAFENQLLAHRGKAIPATTANAWLAQTAVIQAATGC